ncbi:MAG: NAD(+) synthetase, partial [Candidatus Methanoperedens sp.]|nr:NAD(+) synthetase [Candidatus Methanoperedens sp.]
MLGSMKNISYPEIKDKIVAFISSQVSGSGANGAVIGLSGGIDSALTAYLTVSALGKKNVLGLLLPEKGISSKQDI